MVYFWLIAVDWQIKKSLHLGPGSPNHKTFFLKIIALAYIY